MTTVKGYGRRARGRVVETVERLLRRRIITKEMAATPDRFRQALAWRVWTRCGLPGPGASRRRPVGHSSTPA